MKTVTVSQAPAVSEAPAVATPAEGGATMATLPSAVQDLARFFLSLSGSSSLGAVGRAHGGTPGDSRPLRRSGFTQVAVVDLPLLREWRMMTVPVPSSRWTSIGTTLSDLSWPSSGTFTTWKSRQEYHQLGARRLLHRSMV